MILRWNDKTTLPVETDRLTPEGLLGRTSAEVSKLRIRVGNQDAELGDVFSVVEESEPILSLEGDLVHVRGIGRGMERGTLIVNGVAGPHLGARMSGGVIEVRGDVDDWAGAEMRGGLLRISGNARRYLGASYPGQRVGMRGGVILVGGDAGDEAGRRMRRGLIAVGGAVGESFGQGAGCRLAVRVRADRPVRRDGHETGHDRRARPDATPSCCRRSRRAGVTVSRSWRCTCAGFRTGGSRSRARCCRQRWSVTMATSRTVAAVNYSCGPDRTKAETAMNLNGRSLKLAESLLDRAEERKVAAHPIEKGGRYVDCGIATTGGLKAGIELARVCMADLADVSLVSGDIAGRACPLVQVFTDHPVDACLASQYAGWAIQEGKFFAMGSGPMRAASGKEAVFDKIGRREQPEAVVGVLETRKAPNAGRRGADRVGVRRVAVVGAALGGAHGQPRGGNPGGRAFGRDRPAQAGRTRFRRQPRGLRLRLRAIAAGRPRRPRRHRPDQRLDPLRRAGRPLRPRR